ncbi:interleukin-17C isoform X2 [Neoarius graeffei]|uniref:interleukin-17C isoform X2 n=1 Tax=Neoarius graeffei TaxID=443677 RepID=UPI00298C5BA4|nr:interleukin-17C isoform X2 [Neoarius graeffei]
MWFSLLFGVLLLSLTDALTEQRHKGCLPQHEFTVQAKKLLRRAGRHAEHRAAAARSAPTASCSDFTQIFSHELKNRSLSPWRSSFETDHSLIPPVYEVAECLCSGCIIDGSENTDYNSVPVMQSVMFLKKISCLSDPDNYSYNVVYKTLPVACTCVMPSNTLL